MNPLPEPYHAYLLRLWQIEQNDHLVWRSFLEDVHTGERHAFAGTEGLIAFLEEMERGARETPDENHQLL